jgi:hypothetical protein
MTNIGHLEDTDIDLAIDEGEAGERRATELATRLRMVAAQDPLLAQDLVEELIVALDKAMGPRSASLTGFYVNLSRPDGGTRKLGEPKRKDLRLSAYTPIEARL